MDRGLFDDDCSSSYVDQDLDGLLSTPHASIMDDAYESDLHVLDILNSRRLSVNDPVSFSGQCMSA